MIETDRVSVEKLHKIWRLGGVVPLAAVRFPSEIDCGLAIELVKFVMPPIAQVIEMICIHYLK